jgi:hypothetical protein
MNFKNIEIESMENVRYNINWCSTFSSGMSEAYYIVLLMFVFSLKIGGKNL